MKNPMFSTSVHINPTTGVLRSARKAHVKAGLLAVSTLMLALSAALAVHAQVGQTGDTGIDTSGNAQTERMWCLANMADVGLADCLSDTRSAIIENRRGGLTVQNDNFRRNALLRCNVFEGQERQVCQARVTGLGQSSGSVMGGGIIREIETQEMLAGQTALIVVPKSKK
jgi:hypothetical protein